MKKVSCRKRSFVKEKEHYERVMIVECSDLLIPYTGAKDE